MKLRRIALLLCVVMLFTLLTACGNQANDKTPNTSTPNTTTAPGTNDGTVNDTDGLIDEQDSNQSRARTDVPVTDRVMTDMDNAMDRTGNAIENGADRMMNAAERGVNDLTGRNTSTRTR